MADATPDIFTWLSQKPNYTSIDGTLYRPTMGEIAAEVGTEKSFQATPGEQAWYRQEVQGEAIRPIPAFLEFLSGLSGYVLTADRLYRPEHVSEVSRVAGRFNGTTWVMSPTSDEVVAFNSGGVPYDKLRTRNGLTRPPTHHAGTNASLEVTIQSRNP